MVARVSSATVGIDRIPDARVTARMDERAFDPLVRGTMAIGAGVAGLMQVEQDKADTAAVLEAKRKLGDWERSWFDPNNASGVYARKGRDALGLADDIDPDFERVRTELGSSLKSERARQVFEEYALSRRDSILDRVQGYAVGEHDAYVDAEFKASVLTTAEAAARAALDGRWDEQATLASDGLRTIRAQGKLNGEAPEVTQVREREFLSSVHATAVNGFLARGQSVDAASYLHDNADAISADVLGDLTARLRPMLVDATANAIVDGLDVGTLPEGLDQSVDTLWSALEWKESRGQQSAVSPKGAVGVAQIMPATGPIAARMAGVEWDPERFKTDAAYNRQLGQAYLQTQLTTFGSAPLALAAYNAGPGRVQQWIERFGDPRRGEITLEQFVERIPYRETKDYVQTILGRVGGGGGSGGAPASASPSPRSGSLEDQLAPARSIADPQLRAEVEARVRQRYNDRKVAEAELERTTQMAIYETVNTMPANGDWRSALTVDQRAYADQHNLSPSLDEQMQRRRAGVPVVTPPHVANALNEVIRQAALGQRFAAEELMSMRPYDPRMPYSDEDRALIAKTQIALKSGDRATLAASASDAEISGTIATFRRRNLGISDAAIKDATSDAAQRALAFEQELRMWVSDYSAANNGKKPSYREVQERADALTFATQARVPGRIWGHNVEPIPAFEVTTMDQIPEQYRQQLVDAFPGQSPTEQQLVERYREAARRGLLR